MKTFMGRLALAALLGSTAGCASIISDSDYPVSFQSQLNGVNFTVTDERGRVVHQGVAPTTITLPAGDGFFDAASYTIEYTKDGYEAGRTELKAGLDGWYIGNIIFGGLLGILIIDPATGAMWRLDDTAHAPAMAQVQPPLAPTETTDAELALKLEELRVLHERELITQSEYEAKRAELLATF